MNKVLSLLAPLALGCALAACEDVPAPYVEPVNPVQPVQPGTQSDVLINEPFTTQLGGFASYTTAGSGAWKIDFKTAKASGYDQGTKTTTAGTYYLVSPEVDLTQVKGAHIKFDYILRYSKAPENQQLLITDQFDTNNPAAQWTLLNQDWTEGRDWTTFSSYTLNLPTEWMGRKVRIALRYNTNEVSGSTWEVKNFLLVQGKAEATPSDPTPPPTDPIAPPTTANLLQNGDFETWSNDLPTFWKSASTTSSATLRQSTTAHGGSSAVLVEGHAEQNKRLAHQELTLKAGTYTLFFYARGAADGASVRPGYAVVEGGKIDSKTGYKYGNYVNDLKAAEWTAVSHTFKLDAPATIALLVMNPKGKGNVLIDDFSLTTSDGGIQTATQPDQPTTALYNKSLLDNAEGWTLNEGTLPAELPQVWTQSEKYGLVATGYQKSSKQRYAAEALAISPEIQLTKNNTLTFEHAANYFGNATLSEMLLLQVREVGTSEWKALTIPTLPSGKDFNYVSSGAISLQAWAGKKVQLGFKYVSTTTIAGTWEFKNIVVQ